MLEELKKFYNLEIENLDTHPIYSLERQFIINAVKNKKIEVVCLESSKKLKSTSYFLDIELNGIIYFFENENPFVMFYGFGHDYSMLNAVYYYKSNKLYNFTPFSMRWSEKYKEIDRDRPYNNNKLINIFQSNLQFFLDNRRNIKNNKMSCIFSKHSSNLSHYILDIIGTSCKLIELDIIKNFDNILQTQKAKEFDYIKVASYISEKYNIPITNKIKGIPVIINCVIRHGIFDKDYINGFNKIITYNSSKLEDDDLIRYVNDKIIINLRVKTNRRIFINEEEYFEKLIISFYKKYKDKVVFLISGVFKNDNQDLKISEEVKDNNKVFNKIIDRLKKSIDNEFINNNIFNVINYSMLFLLKLFSKVKITIGSAGASFHEVLYKINREVISFTTFPTCTLEKDYKDILVKDYFPVTSFFEHKCMNNNRHFAQDKNAFLIEKENHDFYYLEYYCDTKVDSNVYFLKVIPENSNIRCTKSNYYIPDVDLYVNKILENIHLKD